MEKYCKNCSKYKSFNEFHKHKNGMFGLYSICKLCRKNNKFTTNNRIKTIENNIRCKDCLKTMNSKFFYKNNNSKNGFTTRCKDCYLLNRSNNQSKIENYLKLILDKFKKKHKITFTVQELLRKYYQQNKKCYITKHKMTHIVDKKGRTDNIFNISIITDEEKDRYEIDDIKLTINLFYSVSKKYNLDTESILKVYDELF